MSYIRISGFRISFPVFGPIETGVVLKNKFQFVKSEKVLKLTNDSIFGIYSSLYMVKGTCVHSDKRRKGPRYSYLNQWTLIKGFKLVDN